MKWRDLSVIGLVVLGSSIGLYFLSKERYQNAFAANSVSTPKVAQNRSEAPSAKSLSPSLAQNNDQAKSLGGIFSRAINFYGKVVDEKGAPIAGAQIRYSAPSSFLQIEKGTQSGPVTDKNGLFSITGKRGAGIYVTVSHAEYYKTDESSGQFSYFENTEQNPTANKPQVFILRKKGLSEPLLKMKQVVKSISQSGTPIRIDLTGEKEKDLNLQTWVSAPSEPSRLNAPFAWKIRIEVAGGGLVAYEGGFKFEAPEDGYVPFVEFEMPESGRDGKWSRQWEQGYFVRLGDGKYARMRFQMVARGNHFAVVESYYNPSGSRNLEFDPAKQIRSR